MDTTLIVKLGTDSGTIAGNSWRAFWGTEAASHPITTESYIDHALADLGVHLPGFFGLDFATAREAIALHVLAARRAVGA